jgi:hypothetical protein
MQRIKKHIFFAQKHTVSESDSKRGLDETSCFLKINYQKLTDRYKKRLDALAALI